MAPALTSQPDKHPERELSPCRPRRIARSLTQLLKSNLKNLLADCNGELVARGGGGAGVLPHAPAAPQRPAMKNVLGEYGQPTPSIMDGGKLGQDDDVMGLHSLNSQSLQELILSKKQLAESLAAAASSPPPDLVDIMRELGDGERAPAAGGNGDVPADDVQLVCGLVDGVDAVPEAAPPEQPAPQVAVAAPAPSVAIDAARGRQRELEGRVLVLMRRLRALQARSARHQTSAQGQALLERLSAAPAPSVAPAAPANHDITAVLRSPDAKNYSTTQLVNLVLNNKQCSSPGAAAGWEGAAASCRLEREEAAGAAARPAAIAAAQVARLTAAEDSDATESSSGGESGDEFDHGWDDCARDRAAPIRKRALWRWMSDRSAVASRWSWLTAQVTDLEFRIRQLRELHRQLRAVRHPAPGAETCGALDAHQAAAGELGGAGDASSAALRSVGKAGEAPGSEDGQCARTRPCTPGPRRRLFSVWRAPRRPMPAVAARCRCDPGAESCVTCAGRRDYLPRVRPDTQPLRERLAQLEPSCHPVLSLPGEPPLSLGYDALLRSTRWQQNHLHARPRLPAREPATPSQPTPPGAPPSPAIANSATPASAAAAAAHTVTRPSFHRRRPGMLKRQPELDGESELSLSSGSVPPGGGQARPGRPPKSARRSRSTSTGAPPEEAEPRPTPLQRYRQRQQSYDIDNIVIPASMASNTRIEKPKYKEIVTPGWRTVQLQPAAVNGSGPAAGPAEPLEDTAYEERHWQAELAERQRLYQSCQGTPAGDGVGHGRGRRAHTPDAAAVGAEPAGGATITAPAQPRILRYHHVPQPCGFPRRKFPLAETEWRAVLAGAEDSASSPVGWRSPASLTGSSTESAPEAEEHRRAPPPPHRK